MDKQFLKYVPVHGEKHIGIAIVRWLGKIILRYKILPSQDGSGYWVSAGSTKMGLRPDGKDKYEEWFQLDSSYDKEEMKDFVLANVEIEIKKTSGNAFAASPSALNNNSNQTAFGTNQTQSNLDDDLPF